VSDSGKRIFLIVCVVVPFIAYCVYYYSIILKNAPYKFAEFKSFTIQYGEGNNLVNKYDSKTGEYQYLNTHDSLVRKIVHLNKNDLLYLHRKASDLGFWDFPVEELGDTSIAANKKAPRYLIEYNYLHKSKKVVFDA
jgi:hypothetical protein